jgi:hypothetical protein
MFTGSDQIQVLQIAGTETWNDVSPIVSLHQYNLCTQWELTENHDCHTKAG